MKTCNLVIGKLLPFVLVIDYRIGPSPARPAAAAIEASPIMPFSTYLPEHMGSIRLIAARAFCRGLAAPS